MTIHSIPPAPTATPSVPVSRPPAQPAPAAPPPRIERPHDAERPPPATVYQAAPPQPTVNETGQTVGTIINITA